MNGPDPVDVRIRQLVAEMVDTAQPASPRPAPPPLPSPPARRSRLLPVLGAVVVCAGLVSIPVWMSRGSDQQVRTDAAVTPATEPAPAADPSPEAVTRATPSSGTPNPEIAVIEGGPILDIDVGRHPVVELTFRAPPALGFGPVTATEVTIVENGEQRPFELTAVTATALEVVLVVDSSGSMNADGAIDAAKAAARSLVEQLPDGSKIALLAFGDTPSLVSGFTSDRTAVLTLVDSLSARGETALYDGVVEAARLLSSSTNGSGYVVLLSDGGDTVSETSFRSAQKALRTADAPLLAISLTTNESDPQALEALARETGGVVVEARDAFALAGIYERIAAGISVEYRVRFVSGSSRSSTIALVVSRGAEFETGTVLIELPG